MSRNAHSTSWLVRIKRGFYHFSHYPPQAAYALGMGSIIGRVILLLTTTGRKSGKKRVTPLQYEEIDGKYYIGAAFGEKADWVKNLRACPLAEIRVRSERLPVQAEMTRDVVRIADFLELKLSRHPHMVAAILKSDGVKYPLSRVDLEKYAEKLTLVVLAPVRLEKNQKLSR